MTAGAALYSWQHDIRQWLVGRQYRLFCASSTCGNVVEPENVLLVLAGLIGDSVMSTPVLVAARALWPNARMTLLGRRHNLALLEACPHIDDFLLAESLPFSLRGRRQVKRLQHEVSKQKFHAAIILLGDQFAHLLAKANIPVRVGVRGTSLEPCLTHTYSALSPRQWGPNERLNALRVLGYDVEESLLQLWVNDRARVSAEAKLSELGMSRGERYVAVHPFGSTARQRWPLTNIEVLGRELREHGMRLVVLGGPEFKLLLPTSNRSGLINTVGKLTIPELLAVIDRAAAVVSTDSGPFHIAGALGRPLVGLFRSSRPEHARRYPQARVILGRSAGCEGRCRWDYCRSAPCRQLEAIGVNEVMAMLEQALSSDQPAISV